MTKRESNSIRHIGSETMVSVVSEDRNDLMLTNLTIETNKSVYKFERTHTSLYFNASFKLLVTRGDKKYDFMVKCSSRRVNIGELVGVLNDNFSKIEELIKNKGRTNYEIQSSKQSV